MLTSNKHSKYFASRDHVIFYTKVELLKIIGGSSQRYKDTRFVFNIHRNRNWGI
jgi:hypothetical protein